MRTLLIFIGVHGPLYAQVNTELMRKYTADRGFHHTLAFSFSHQKGNSDVLLLKSSYRIDWLTTNYYSFVSAYYERGKSNGVLNAHRAFVHLRVSRSLTDVWIAEAFAQKEFNDFLRLNDRQLGGGGLRFEFLNRDSTLGLRPKFLAATGTGLMAEYERLEDPGSTDHRVRSTNYLSLIWQPDARFSVSSIVYYQVALNDGKDFRILSDQALTIGITRHFNVVTSLNVRYDHEPPAGVRSRDWIITNGFSVTF